MQREEPGATDFLEFVRDGDWASVQALINAGQVSSSIRTPGPSVFAWFIEINAPAQLVVELLQLCVETESIDPNRLGLLEACMAESTTKANAFETFRSLLEYGLSPNVIADGGATLLQKAMELNKVREVTELLRHKVDPYQMSVFGEESTSNLEEAAAIGNAASALVLRRFGFAESH